MPFNGADRSQLHQLAEQLTRIQADLAALKQHAADQQHALDQTRQDTTAAITTGLAEIRAVARDGIARSQDITNGPLANIGNELVAIRGSITHLDVQLKAQAIREPAPPADDPTPLELEAAPAPEPEPEAGPAMKPEPGPDPEPPTPTPDPAILRAAAGIAHATIQAHRDTWAFLVQTAGNEQHFHIPGKVKDDNGFVSARISGPSIVAAITSLERVARTAPNPVTQAIAEHIHDKVTSAVQAIIDRPRTTGDGAPVRIVIDDQAQASEGDDHGGREK